MKRLTAVLAAACLGLIGTAGAMAATAHTSASGAVVSTRSTSLGKVLVGGNGRTLYMFSADKKGKSACSTTCAAVWIPLTTHGAPRAAGGAKAGDLGTIKRTGGAKQVTYKGHPLYSYVADTAPGQVTGQGLNEYGGWWYAVTAAGKQAGHTSSSSSSSSSSKGGW
jgi:predicted lipoprotein with Yx(FWY)xxD motif